MKKLKKDEINFSKAYSKFIPVPFITIIFVICYCAMPFLKILTVNGESCSALDLIKSREWIYGLLYAIPQAIILVYFVIMLVGVIRKKAFHLLDLSETVGQLFYAVAIYGILFVAMSNMFGGGMSYVNWMILIPIIYIAAEVIVNFVCCFMSGKVKLPVLVIVNYCIRIALFAILILLLANVSILQNGDEAITIFHKGQLIIFNSEIVSTLIESASDKFIFVWATTILMSIMLIGIINCLCKIIQAYKEALLYKNKDLVKQAVGDECQGDIDEYMNRQEVKLAFEGSLLESCREELSMKDALLLIVIGIALFVTKMDFIVNSDNEYLKLLAVFSNTPSIVCWATLLVGAIVLVMHFVTKKMTYKRLVKIEELTEALNTNNETVTED